MAPLTRSKSHSDLTKLCEEKVLSRQATVKIGTIGHEDHGKSTVVKRASIVQSANFKNKLERHIIIKLERLPKSVIALYSQREQESEEIKFLEEMKNAKRSRKEDHAKPQSKKPRVEYIIENIIDFKFELGKEMFLIQWFGGDDRENTWEPIENLGNCNDVLRQFLASKEEEHCAEIEKLRDKISFDGLLNDTNLFSRLFEVEQSNMAKLKTRLMLKLLSMIYLLKLGESHVPHLVQETRNILQLYVATRRRCRQMMSLTNWEDFLNKSDESKNLSVENYVDFTGKPDNFSYTYESVLGAGVIIPNKPAIGCKCVSCNYKCKSCCGMKTGRFAYTVRKKVSVDIGTPIYECNKACKCSLKCNNRVVQMGSKVKLTIFRTHNGCGWGVKAGQRIKKGQFICQYVGEVITFREAEKREKKYRAYGFTNHYLFNLDFYTAKYRYVVDATNKGNVSHFINHSCDPNSGVWAVWVDCLDPNLHLLAFFAIRDIETGEEICLDYKYNTLDKHRKRPAIYKDNTASLNHHIKCKCGTIKCRKFVL